MPSAWTDYNPLLSPLTANGTDFGVGTIDNQNDLWRSLVMLGVRGWTMALSGGTSEEPAVITFSNTVNTDFKIRSTITWGTTGGANGNVTAILWEVQNDATSTATWATAYTTTATYDSGGHMTACTNGGMFIWLLQLIGKVKFLYDAIASVGGGGTMGAQNATAVAITGGTLEAKYFRELVVTKGSVSGATAISFNDGSFFTITCGTSAASINFTNKPNGKSQYITVDVTNGGVASSFFPTVGGLTPPALTAIGLDRLIFECHDGSNVFLSSYTLDM